MKTHLKTALVGIVTTFSVSLSLAQNATSSQASGLQGMTSQFQSLCEELKARAASIENATAAGVNLKTHPLLLPSNPFKAEGLWQAHSTLEIDGKIRAHIRQIADGAVQKLRAQPQGSLEASRHALVQSFEQVSQACQIQYTNSNKVPQKLSLAEALRRMGAASFDPYHCPEKKWGAEGSELRTCRDHDDKNEWYEAEAHMRNVVGKHTAEGAAIIRSIEPISLDLMISPYFVDQGPEATINLGTRQKPAVDLSGFLKSEKLMKLLKTKPKV